ncbi:MAG: ornithine carbamoyltransferase, partial [Candidatus Micrarchaeota archaeon]|nr:ornithine carbamoyltransferase [Candidatus Micrarchaeota archaeon]
MVRHLLTLKELTPKEVETIIDMGLDIKKNPSKYSTAMKDKTLCMIFQKTSTRTRLSFETGMTRMGGHAIFLDWRTTQLGMSDIKDEIKVIASYDDIIMARVLRHETVHEMAKWSKVPVINGLCEKYHPCQILVDLMTVKEHFGKLKGLKMAYVGLANNVSNTLTIGCMKTGMDFVLSAPE